MKIEKRIGLSIEPWAMGKIGKMRRNQRGMNAADRASEMRTEEELFDLTMARALVT